MAEYRARGFSRISAILPKLTETAFEDGGSVKAKLLTQWASIVGNEIAARAQPQNVTFSRGNTPLGTLHLEVEGGYATEISYLEPVILEKIAVYCGYKAIHRIKLHPASR